MVKTLLILLLVSGSSVLLTSCGPASGAETSLCEYDGYQIIDYVKKTNDCQCGDSYYLHVRSGNNFEHIHVNEAVWGFYLKEKPKEGYYKITCKEEIELKDA